jgi:lytic murein transglycosylase
VAIWGIETGYGSFLGSKDAIRSLATLTFIGYRADYFRAELFHALAILQDGDVKRSDMQGSWAGAVGNTQFMPSSFRKFAVDFDGDGRRDLRASVADALASAGNYLKGNGWISGLPWGFQVEIPAEFDYRRSRGTTENWAALGVRRSNGEPLPAGLAMIMFFPSGAEGPAFLVTENFNVLKTYNNSDSYSLAVGHLADQIAGRKPVPATWPTARPLSREVRIELQHLLAVADTPSRISMGGSISTCATLSARCRPSMALCPTAIRQSP